MNEGLDPLELLIRQEGRDHPDRQALKDTHQVVEMLNISLRKFRDPSADIRNNPDESMLFECFQGFSNLAPRNAKDARERNLHEPLTGFEDPACDPGFEILDDLLALREMICRHLPVRRIPHSRKDHIRNPVVCQEGTIHNQSYIVRNNKNIVDNIFRA
jgi:hypothetical protein